MTYLTDPYRIAPERVRSLVGHGDAVVAGSQPAEPAGRRSGEPAGHLHDPGGFRVRGGASQIAKSLTSPSATAGG